MQGQPEVGVEVEVEVVVQVEVEVPVEGEGCEEEPCAEAAGEEVAGGRHVLVRVQAVLGERGGKGIAARIVKGANLF